MMTEHEESRVRRYVRLTHPGYRVRIRDKAVQLLRVDEDTGERSWQFHDWAWNILFALEGGDMKLTIEPTENFFMQGEVMVRAWKGTAEDGQSVIALVACVCLTGDVRDHVLAAPGLISIPEPDQDEQRRWAQHIMGAGGSATAGIRDPGIDPEE